MKFYAYHFWFFGEPSEGDKAMKIFDDLVAQNDEILQFDNVKR